MQTSDVEVHPPRVELWAHGYEEATVVVAPGHGTDGMLRKK